MSQSRAVNIWVALGIITAGLAIFAGWANFFHSGAWGRVAVVLAIGISLALTVSATTSAMRSNFGYPEIRSKAVRLGVVLVIVPVTAMFVSWRALAIALPDIITRATGSPFVETLEFERSYVDSHRRCDYRVFAAAFAQNGANDYYCADADEFSRLPASGHARVRGRQSWFGRHIDKVEAADLHE